MRLLYVTTIAGTMTFFEGIIKELISSGHCVDIATNEEDSKLSGCYREWGCKVYHISCTRSPFARGNLKAVLELKEIVLDNHYDIVHCHTPIAAACTRIACREARKRGTKVIYTAHGFHFYTGAPLKNWLIYYPVERLCSRWTDVQITITKEDFERAKRKLHAKRTVYIPGVGINLDLFGPKNGRKYGAHRAELNLSPHAKMLLSVGELNENKNHQVVLRAMAALKRDDLYYVICGEGSQRAALKQLAENLKITDHVFLLGVRSDVLEWMAEADIYVHPSLREGLSVATMEAMASGLPVICGDIRGNRDLIQNEVGGFLVQTTHPQQFASAIDQLLTNEQICEQMGKRNTENVKSFSLNNVVVGLKEIYGV